MFQNKLKIWLIYTGLLCISINSYAFDRLIIKYKPTSEQVKVIASKKLSTLQSTIQLNQILMQPLSSSQVSKLSQMAGVVVKDDHAIATGAHVLILEKNVTQTELEKIINKIKQDPVVDYVVEDRIVKHMSQANPNTQWDMMTSPDFAPNPAWIGDNFVNAWPFFLPPGGPGHGVIVAVVDTGYTPHPNFLPNLQVFSPGAYGYQFISDCRIAGACPANQLVNTSLSPQANALDQGDFITAADAGTLFFSGCPVGNSSWHGSHVIGTIGGNGYNGSSGIAGGAWGANVLPVRVLGKCGGYMSDINNGAMWAAGFPIINTPTNPNPAQVINLSLGGAGACDADTQNAINQIAAANVAFVVAAGNEAANLSTSSPANCQNVISVSAKSPDSTLADYSNFGATTISASGGSGGGGASDIYSTIWNSPQAYNPSGQPAFAYYAGTSMAAPHVSAALADIISLIKSQGNTYGLSRIVNILKSSASKLANNCNVSGCAANGLALNVAEAVTYVHNDMSLTPSLLSVIFNEVNRPITITFTNPSSTNAVTISGITLPAGVIINPSSTCVTGFTVGSNASCIMIISAGSSIPSAVAGALVLQGGANGATVLLSTVTLSYALPAAPAPRAGGGGGGGGCTAIASGDDLGLLLSLLSITLYAYLRRKILLKK
jgi:serine protease